MIKENTSTKINNSINKSKEHDNTISLFEKNINLVTKGGGIILLITGVLILTNQLQILGYYILNYLPFLQNFG